MQYDLFTPKARRSICRYFAPVMRDPPMPHDAVQKSVATKILYNVRFKTKLGRLLTDAHMWACLVSEIIKCSVALDTISLHLLGDIVCAEWFVTAPERQVRRLTKRRARSTPRPDFFIEPFFTDWGRRLLIQHYGTTTWNSQTESNPRDSDLWISFVGDVSRAVRRRNAPKLGEFLMGPYTVLATKESA